MEGGDTSRCMFLRLYVLSWRSHTYKKIPHINLYTLKASKRHLHFDDFKCAVFEDFKCCEFDVKFEIGTIFNNRNYNNLFHIILKRFVTTIISNFLVNANRLPDSHHYIIYVSMCISELSGKMIENS